MTLARLIEARQRTVYWAPTRKRHYAKLSDACAAEARTIVKRAWHRRGNEGYWADDLEAVQVCARLARRIERNARAAILRAMDTKGGDA